MLEKRLSRAKRAWSLPESDAAHVDAYPEVIKDRGLEQQDWSCSANLPRLNTPVFMSQSAVSAIDGSDTRRMCFNLLTFFQAIGLWF